MDEKENTRWPLRSLVGPLRHGDALAGLAVLVIVVLVAVLR